MADESFSEVEELYDFIVRNNQYDYQWTISTI